MAHLSKDIISELVVMADRFDQNGQFDMAAKVDTTIRSMARGRPKSPLKNLDDDVKESLVKFLHNISKRMEASKNDLEELFRRMRYFDVADSAKPLGLDKALKDLSRVQECVDAGKESLHGMLGGNKSNLKALIEKLNDGEDDANDLEVPKHNPLDFFDSRQDDEDEAEDEDESGEEEPSAKELEEKDEALQEFWKNYEELESFEDDEEETA